jgi:hypothetical protein
MSEQITERGDPRDYITNQLPLRHRRTEMESKYVSGGTALEIELVEESTGYELQLTNEDGRVFTFNVHVAAMSLVKIGQEIGDYFREGERLAREHQADLDRAEAAREAGFSEAFIGLGQIDGGGP